jgi:mycofactocin glycosyltransferase
VTAPLPAGFWVELDPGTRQLTDSVLFGGAPARAIRLSAAGCRALAELRDGPVRSAGAAVLGRRLTDAGLAHPRPPAGRRVPGVTILIPVRDRATLLDQCLAAAGREHRVVVVDDGSADPVQVAAIAARHGATLVRRTRSGGPAAARNTGLAVIETDLVAFLDSDCVPPPGWIAVLAAHLADPLVGAVAPRVVGPAGLLRAACRYAAACGSLDLGPGEGRVVPATRVAYVPTAALLVRREALEKLAADGGPVFDPALRYGEDVDLIWRLHAAGWRIRYEPAVRVPHYGPATWTGLLAKRFSYGTSAAPLARRHAGALAPLVLQPWPAATVAALLARRPLAAAAAAAASWLTLTGTVQRAGLPADRAGAASAVAIRQTWLGAGRYATQFAAPVLAVALAAPGGRTPVRRWGRRAAAASLLLGPVGDAWQQRRPDLDPVRFALGHIADDIAYGAGVWAGCVRERTLAPVIPAISWRPLRVTGPGGQPESGRQPDSDGRPGSGSQPGSRSQPGNDARQRRDGQRGRDTR